MHFTSTFYLPLNLYLLQLTNYSLAQAYQVFGYQLGPKPDFGLLIIISYYLFLDTQPQLFPEASRGQDSSFALYRLPDFIFSCHLLQRSRQSQLESYKHNTHGIILYYFLAINQCVDKKVADVTEGVHILCLKLLANFMFIIIFRQIVKVQHLVNILNHFYIQPDILTMYNQNLIMHTPGFCHYILFFSVKHLLKHFVIVILPSFFRLNLTLAT